MELYTSYAPKQTGTGVSLVASSVASGEKNKTKHLLLRFTQHSGEGLMDPIPGVMGQRWVMPWTGSDPIIAG